MELEERPEGWLERLYGELTPGGLPLNSTSQALEASRVVKSGAGILLGFSGFNNGAGQFVLVFDAQVAPAAGAVPVIVVSAPGAANFSYDAGTRGRAFSRGIVLATSTTAATFTAGGANAWFDAQYL